MLWGEERLMTMALTGRVVSFDPERGFGFITPDDGGQGGDVFLHVNGLAAGNRQLVAVGRRVAFRVAEGPRGQKAFEVRVLSGEDEVVQGAVELLAPRAADVDGTCDVLTNAELLNELTAALLVEAPTLTGEQILGVRRCVLSLAGRHDWVLND